MNIEQLAILDYVYSRAKTDKEFSKQIEDAIKQRIVDGDWKVFDISHLRKDVNNIINELDRQFIKKYTQQEFVNTLMKDTPDKPVSLKEQFQDVSTLRLDDIDFSVLKGKTITEIEGLEQDGDEVYIKTSDGCIYKMFHEQDCCENVWIDYVCGDEEDLVGSPVLFAEKRTNGKCFGKPPVSDVSYTCTLYRLATTNGYVDIHWYGISNGSCSKSVNFKQLK